MSHRERRVGRLRRTGRFRVPASPDHQYGTGHREHTARHGRPDRQRHPDRAEHPEAAAWYLRAGGGYVGVHAAAETEPDWPFYRNLVGAGVSAAPAVARATVRVADRAHPSTETVPRA